MYEAGKQSRYALVIRVPREVEVRIEDAYLDLLSMTRPTMGYHITLLGPLTLAEGDGERFRAKMSSVCHDGGPFRVHIGGLDAFEQKDSNAVYLKVRRTALLMDLQRQLAKSVVDLVDHRQARNRGHAPEDFRPHITLGLGLTDRELEVFLRTVSSEQGDQRGALAGTFQVTELWLVEQRPNEPWRHIVAFSLGTAADDTSSRPTSDWDDGE